MADIDRPGVPAPRQAEREVAIRELRNAGKVLAALADAGSVGRVTSGGRLVGWLIPASPEDQRVEELTAQGRLRPGRGRRLTSRDPLPRRTDVPSLGETLEQMRAEERC